MNRRNSDLRVAHPGMPTVPLKMPDKYFDQNGIIDRDLHAINQVADPLLVSVSLLKKKNALLKREIARVSKIIEESERLGR